MKVLERRCQNLLTRKQLSVIVANILGIRKGIVQTKNMAHPVRKMWFKLMIMAVNHIYYVFHPASA